MNRILPFFTKTVQDLSICEEIIFKRTFDRWQQSLQHFLLAKGVYEKNVADLVQESFVRLWKKCADLSEENAGAFLFTTAKNLGVDQFRKEKTALKYRTSLNQRIEVKDGQYYMEAEEFRLRLENAIASMTEASKEVFILHRFDNMKYKEIAQTLGISVKAVEKRMHKALKHLSDAEINLKRR